VDSLKWFLDWKYFGKEGLGKRVRRYLELAEYAEARITAHPELDMVAPRESFNVCFRYLPPEDHDTDAFNLKLRHHLFHEGVSLVGVAYIGNRVTLRLLITHPDFTRSDVERFLDSLVNTARGLLNRDE